MCGDWCKIGPRRQEKRGKAFGGIESCGAWQQIDTAMSYGIACGGGAVGVLRRWRSAEILGSASLLVVPGCQSPFICRFSLCRELTNYLSSSTVVQVLFFFCELYSYLAVTLFCFPMSSASSAITGPVHGNDGISLLPIHELTNSLCSLTKRQVKSLLLLFSIRSTGVRLLDRKSVV